MEDSSLEEQLKLEKEKKEEGDRKIEELKKKINSAYQKLDSLLSNAKSPEEQSQVIRSFHEKVTNREENIEIPEGSAVFEELQVILAEQKSRNVELSIENEKKQNEINELRRKLKSGFNNADSYLGEAQSAEEKQKLIKEFQERQSSQQGETTIEISQEKSSVYEELQILLNQQKEEYIKEKEENEKKQKEIQILKAKLKKGFNNADAYLGEAQTIEERQKLVKEFQQQSSTTSTTTTFEINEEKSQFYQELEQRLLFERKSLDDKEKRIEALKQKIHNAYGKVDSLLSSGKSSEEKDEIKKDFHQKITNENDEEVQIPEGSALYDDLQKKLKEQKEQYEAMKKESDEKDQKINQLQNRPIYLIIIIGLLLAFIVMLLLKGKKDNKK